MSSWLKYQRMSLQAVAAHLTRQGYGAEIQPTLERGEALEHRRHAFVAKHKATTAAQRELEAQHDLLFRST